MLVGLSLALVSGTCLGIFLAPMKKLENWEWEHFWVVWSLVGLLLGPIAVAFLTISHCIQVFETIGLPLLALTVIVGMVAGISGFLYSLTIPVLGLGLATALNAGSSMATSLLPLAGVHANTMLRASGLLTLAGVAITIAGVSVCAKAGDLREREEQAKNAKKTPDPTKLTFIKGVVFCVVAGIIASGVNLGLAFPNRILDAARKFGSSEFGAANAFMLPYLMGAFFSNTLYAGRRVYLNHNFARFLATGALRSFCWSAFMGLVFLLGMVSYTAGVSVLGSFGAIVAWGIQTAATILASSLWDVAQKAWRGRPVQVMAAGVGLLLGAILVLGLAQYLYQFEGYAKDSAKQTRPVG